MHAWYYDNHSYQSSWINRKCKTTKFIYDNYVLHVGNKIGNIMKRGKIMNNAMKCGWNQKNKNSNSIKKWILSLTQSYKTNL